MTTVGLEKRFQGVTTSAATVLIMPPTLKVIFCGQTLARSYAGETKLATMLTPMVAMAKVSAATTSTQVSPTLATSSAGSVMACPNASSEPAVTITETTTNAVELMGSPQKLPRLTVRSSGAKREKSQKLSISVP